MGSYGVTCGLTGLALQHGDAAGYIPLAVSRHRHPYGLPVLTDVCAAMAPIGPPVFGFYDSYGRLDTGTYGELAIAAEVFDRPGLFFHRAALEAIAAEIKAEPDEGCLVDTVRDHWGDLAANLTAEDGNPLTLKVHQDHARYPWGHPLLRVLLRTTAWPEEGFEILRDMTLEQVTSMVSVVDAAMFLGRPLAPSGYLGDGYQAGQVRMLARLATELEQSRQDLR